jgi:alpha-tubulin suppressor-like RCC1 family protein
MRSTSAVALSSSVFAVLLTGCGTEPTAPVGLAPASAVAAASGLSFKQIDRFGAHTCAVTADSRAYCWGANDRGQLGNGSTGFSAAPSLVAGGLRFRHVSVGNWHSCGVTTTNLVYCWGDNFHGELGDGTGYPENTRRLTPVLVKGGHRFRLVRGGNHFTCAVAADGSAFCWGYNAVGQLGDGTRTSRHVPVRVKGSHQWRQLKAGESHVCGVTIADRAFCWGMNFWGQLGDGTQNVPGKPVAVAGGLRFRWVTAGGAHSCGVTTADRAYCWGRAEDGQLGDGSPPPVFGIWSPVTVATTVRFDHVMAGADHTCGVALSGRAFCWGRNAWGEVGNGGTGLQPTPVAVAGGLLFTQVRAGRGATVGITADGVAYRWGISAGNVSSVPVVDP